MKSFVIMMVQLMMIVQGAAQVEDAVTDSMRISSDAGDAIEQTRQAEKSNILDEVRMTDSAGLPRLTLRSRLESILQPAAGYTDGKYAGSSLHSYQKILWRSGQNFQAAMLFEKDPGEKKVNDFTSVHLSIKHLGFLSHCIIGDYLVESGQGIALWRGYDYSKGPDVLAPLLRKERMLVPYLSSNEQNFLRGIAASSEFGPVSLSFFASRKTLSSVPDENGTVIVMHTSGEFRTSSELAARDNLTEQLYGGKVSCYIPKLFRGGISILGSRFSRLLNLTSPRLQGDRFSVFSFDYDLHVGALVTSGEWVISNHTTGGIGSLLVSPLPGVRCILSCRIYPSGLFSLHGMGFGEGMETSNEKGLYVGCEIVPGRKLRCAIFFDQFSSMSPSGSSSFPSPGHEMLCTFRTIPLKRTVLEIQYRYKRTRIHLAPDGPGMEFSHDDLSRYSCRIQVKHEVNPFVTLTGRWEYLEHHLRLQDRPACGRLVYADAGISPSKRIKMSYRLIFFSTDSYDSRVSEYEKNLDGAVSIPAFYGDVFKWYVILDLRLIDAFSFSLKYSDLLRKDTRHIGSGLDELPGNHDNRIGLQIDLCL